MVSDGDGDGKFIGAGVSRRVRDDVGWRPVFLDREPGRPTGGVGDHLRAREHAGVEEGKLVAALPVDVPGDPPAAGGAEFGEVGIEEIRVFAGVVGPVDLCRPVHDIAHVVRVPDHERDVQVDERRQLGVLDPKDYGEPLGGRISLVAGEEEVRLEHA